MTNEAMIIMSSNEQQFRSKVSSQLERLERWATREHLAKAYLLIVNCFLALKASTNIISLVIDSRSLILEYNAALLFDSLLRQCLIVVNLMLFASSLFCLLALMLTLKHHTLKQRLIHCFTFSQILLTIVAMLMMAHLWVAPVRVHLTEALPQWRDEIASYTYSFAPDKSGRLPDGGRHPPGPDFRFHQQLSPGPPPLDYISAAGDIDRRHGDKLIQFDASRDGPMEREVASGPERDGFVSHGGQVYMGEAQEEAQPGDLYRGYSSPLDRIQQALGCCGLESPREWSTLNARLGLLAPSCCRRPLAMNVTTASAMMSRRRRARRRIESQANDDDENARPRALEKLKRGNPLLTVMALIKTSLTPGRNHESVGVWEDEHEEVEGKQKNNNLGGHLIYYCPGPSTNDDVADEQQGPTTHNKGHKLLTREEALELQLAIEWTNESPRAQLAAHRIPSGCQRALEERDARCLFSLRLGLLGLVTLLFLNIVAQSAAFEASGRAMRSRRRKDSSILDGSRVAVIRDLGLELEPQAEREEEGEGAPPRRAHLALNINNYNRAPVTRGYNRSGDAAAQPAEGWGARPC